MQKIYLDNAATTPLHEEVIREMTFHLKEHFGNPSSTHEFGRKAKALVETARKDIARHFRCQPSEVIFTAGGSEADNLVLYNAVRHWGIKRIISSGIEHHAVLHTLEDLQRDSKLVLENVRLEVNGDVDLGDLENILKKSETPTLVSLMQVNNEIGNILDVHGVIGLCKKYNALFHSDTVQGVGHVDFNLHTTPIDFLAASAHKFHGPKGVGFAIIRKGRAVHPLIHGGDQEMGTRAGTENTHGILGMNKALQLAVSNLQSDRDYVLGLKQYFMDKLEENIPGVAWNGRSGDPERGAFHILNVRFPKAVPMLLFQLDLKGIAASGGSACQSGSNKGSHVLRAILSEEEAAKTSVRFSFSKYNTRQEIDRTVEVLTGLF